MNIKVLKSDDVPNNFIEDLKTGLLCRPYSIPAKYFYDTIGSELFEKICSTKEYYPSRAEELLLNNRIEEIINKIRPKEIFELGSGSSRKSKIIIDESFKIGCKKYLAFDISENTLKLAGEQLIKKYNGVEVFLHIGDYKECLN